MRGEGALNKSQRFQQWHKMLPFVRVVVLLCVISPLSISLSVKVSSLSNNKALPWENVKAGRIMIVDNFLPQDLLIRLKNDSRDLYNKGLFIPDALAKYSSVNTEKSATKASFNKSRDRTGKLRGQGGMVTQTNVT